MAAPVRCALLRKSVFYRLSSHYFTSNLLQNTVKVQPIVYRNINTIHKFITNEKSKMFKWSLLTLGTGGLTMFITNHIHKSTTDSTIFAKSEDDGNAKKIVPRFKPTRRIRSDTDVTGLKLTLYQYQTCPFCCKIRAYLDYHGFSYDVVEVNSVWRTETKWSTYKKVPILVCHGMGEDGYLQLNDSSVIMSALETYMVDQNQPLDKIVTFYPSMESKNDKGKTVLEFPNKYFVMYMEKEYLPRTPEERKKERKWRTWVDDLLVHTLSPNVYRTPSEAVQAFNYFSHVGQWKEVFSLPERLTVIYLGATVMYFIGKLLKRRYNLHDDVRQSLYDACKDWTKAVGKRNKFLGGNEPNLADLSVYGVLSSIEGCNAFQDLLNNTDIGTWYYNTKHIVELRGGSPMDT